MRKFTGMIMNDRTVEPKELKEDLTHLANGDEWEIESLQELGKHTLMTLAFQKRMLDIMRTALFKEAAYLLRERMDEGISDVCEERLRLCAIRLSEAAREPIAKATTGMSLSDDKT